MKKLYRKPMARKINFNFEKVVAQSTPSCESGIVLKMAPGSKCGTHTPDQIFGNAVSAASLDPNTCGWQATKE